MSEHNVLTGSYSNKFILLGYVIKICRSGGTKSMLIKKPFDEKRVA